MGDFGLVAPSPTDGNPASGKAPESYPVGIHPPARSGRMGTRLFSPVRKRSYEVYRCLVEHRQLALCARSLPAGEKTSLAAVLMREPGDSPASSLRHEPSKNSRPKRSCGRLFSVYRGNGGFFCKSLQLQTILQKTAKKYSLLTRRGRLCGQVDSDFQFTKPDQLDDCLRPTFHSKLLHDITDVVSHRLFTNEELSGYLLGCFVLDQ